MKIFKIRKPKKASLELSLNAIVILILAIAILGLGLAFIRGVFKNISEKGFEMIKGADVTNPPTADTIITITPSEVDMKSGTTKSVQVAFLNTQPDSKNYRLILLNSAGQNCKTAGVICTIKPVYRSSDTLIGKDEVQAWVISLAPSSVATTTPELYTVQIVCRSGTGANQCPTTSPVSYSRDFTVTIRP